MLHACTMYLGHELSTMYGKAVSKATKSQLRACRFQNFPWGAYPQTILHGRALHATQTQSHTCSSLCHPTLKSCWLKPCWFMWGPIRLTQIFIQCACALHSGEDKVTIVPLNFCLLHLSGSLILLWVTVFHACISILAILITHGSPVTAAFCMHS